MPVPNYPRPPFKPQQQGFPARLTRWTRARITAKTATWATGN